LCPDPALPGPSGRYPTDCCCCCAAAVLWKRKEKKRKKKNLDTRMGRTVSDKEVLKHVSSLLYLFFINVLFFK